MRAIGLNPGIRKKGAHTWAAKMIQLVMFWLVMFWPDHYLHDSLCNSFIIIQ